MNNQDEYIEAYFSNKLSDAEKVEFEKRCIREEDFAKEVAFYISSTEAIRQNLLAGKKQEWAKFERSEGNNKGTPLIRLTLSKWLPYAAAACLLFFIALKVFYFSSSPQQLATKYFDEHLLRVSQTMNASKDSLQRGIAAYNNKDYKTALQFFENIYRSHPDQSDALKYIGNVYLATKDYDNALKHYDELAHLEGKYSNPGNFLKAITLMMRSEGDDKRQAKELLQEVVNDKEEGSKVAEEWLKKW